MVVGHYAAGSWRAVVTSYGVVLLSDSISTPVLEGIWSQVSAGRGLPAVLEALTGAFGTSLAEIPPFAVVLREDATIRAVVRGGLELAVEMPGGVEITSGVGVTTWSERTVAGARRVTITVVGADPVDTEYPVRDGIVLVSSITIGLVDADRAADAAAPARPQVSPPVPAAAAVEPEAVADVQVPSPPPVPASTAAAEWAPSPADDDPPMDDDVPMGDDAPAGEEASEGDDAAPDEPSPAPEADEEPADDEDSAAPVVSVPAPVPAAPAPLPTGLIDSASVLSLTDSDTLLPAESTFSRTDPGLPGRDADEPAAETTGFDSMWGETLIRSSDDGVVDASDAPLVGDHDGETVSLAQVRALRAASADTDSTPPLASPRPPAPGRIRMSTGQELLLDRTIVIGRRPRSTRVVGTDLPHLVAVESPGQDISRSHIELRVEGDAIVATDLHTTNGTTLHRAGADPMRLHPGESTVVVAGDLLDLGDGITVAIEETA